MMEEVEEIHNISGLEEHKDELQGKCKICFTREVNTVLVPCGHNAICEQCSEMIRDKCPICRNAVSQIVKIYSA